MPARVLITRTRAQSSALAGHLRRLGAEPILLPLIEIVPPVSFCALDAALIAIYTFDWLVFTSSNAVDATLARAAVLGRPLAPLSAHQRVAAIGEATAAALRQGGLSADLIPSQAVAESLAAALIPHARRADDAAARILLPRAAQARDMLPDTLTAAGAEVTVAAAYRNRIPPASLDSLRRLLTTAPPDAITFTSSSTASSLVTLLDEARLTLPPATLRISIGPITSETLRTLGLAPHAEASATTVAALAETTLAALRAHAH